MRIFSRFKKDKRGMATVEAALILTLLVMLTFGVMEYSWMFFKIQQVTNVARGAAREAVLPDSTAGSVTALVGTMMTDWGMGSVGYTTTIYPAGIETLAGGDIITITISVPYQDIELLGMPLFPTPANLTGSVSMAKEQP